MRVLAAILAALFISIAGALPVVAGSGNPPPPPPPPGCNTCGGPPLPPTIVPTLAPTEVPQEVVRVVMAPNHLKRGSIARLTVVAARDAHVRAIVRYHRGKSTWYQGDVGPHGRMFRRWTVPKNAPLGTGSIVVIVRSARTYRTTVSFTVRR